MKLADVDAATRRAAFGVASDALRIPVRQLEKDFWVTSVLRALTAEYREQFLFKGGTSLSKGWKIIRRFSEDIDLLLLSEPGAQTDALLERMTATAGEVCGSTPGIRSLTAGHARTVEVPYPELPDTPKTPGLRRKILLEPGVRGGPQPREVITVAPLLIDGISPADASGWEDLQPFEVDALHPGRTFVEKLFAVHGLALALIADPARQVKGTEARHFYDLYFLCDKKACPALNLLEDPAVYGDLLSDCERISARWFPARAATRPSGGFRASPAFGDDAIARRIGPAFGRTMDQLCYPDAERPSFDEVRARLRALTWL
jgi:hypothetical protein